MESCYNENLKVYRKIRELGGFEKCEINIIDHIDLSEEARSIERFYVESLNPNFSLNSEYQDELQMNGDKYCQRKSYSKKT